MPARRLWLLVPATGQLLAVVQHGAECSLVGLALRAALLSPRGSR
jgi:hypothetical protein